MSKIVLNRSNFFHNLEICSLQAGSKDKVSIVLKDNAYGHGLLEISKLAHEFGIRKAVVQTLEDANKIKNLFDEILILKVSQNTTYSHNFHIAINDMCEIEQLPANTNVQLKIDTGMHRNGISQNELEASIDSIYSKFLNLTGVFTHHRSADELSSEYFWQKSIFKGIKKRVVEKCAKLNLDVPKFHSCNSSALFRDNNFSEDLCRVGLAAYGYIYNHNLYKNINLKPVLSLIAHKISSRILEKGQCVGYGGTYCSDIKQEVSTYDIGYGDGFIRIDDAIPQERGQNQSFKSIEGYSLLGRVSMDNITLNSVENEVCLFNDVRELAKLHSTIYYEILTSLKPDIPKEIV